MIIIVSFVNLKQSPLVAFNSLESRIWSPWTPYKKVFYSLPFGIIEYITNSL
jgi:hypothetical protein